MTDETIINKLVAAELIAMNEKHKDTNPVRFNTPHEAYAITKEEIEEADYALGLLKGELDCIWQDVKCDMPKHLSDENYKRLRKYALHSIQELIQVAACCDKAVSE